MLKKKRSRKNKDTQTATMEMAIAINWTELNSSPDAAISLFKSNEPEEVKRFTIVSNDWFQYCFKRKSAMITKGSREKPKIFRKCI